MILRKIGIPSNLIHFLLEKIHFYWKGKCFESIKLSLFKSHY